MFLVFIEKFAKFPRIFSNFLDLTESFLFLYRISIKIIKSVEIFIENCVKFRFLKKINEKFRFLWKVFKIFKILKTNKFFKISYLKVNFEKKFNFYRIFSKILVFHRNICIYWISVENFIKFLIFVRTLCQILYF